jgi:hypothetical protein
MIYLSFALICKSALGYAILFFIWIVVFIPNLMVKDHRLSKKAGFQEYKNRTRIISFKFQGDKLALICVLVFVAIYV